LIFTNWLPTDGPTDRLTDGPTNGLIAPVLSANMKNDPKMTIYGYFGPLMAPIMANENIYSNKLSQMIMLHHAGCVFLL